MFINSYRLYKSKKPFVYVRKVVKCYTIPLLDVKVSFLLVRRDIR